MKSVDEVMAITHTLLSIHSTIGEDRYGYLRRGFCLSAASCD